MGQVADTSLAALEQEIRQLRLPPRLQRWLFNHRSRGIHGVHSPLAFGLATAVLMRPEKRPLPQHLAAHFPDALFVQAPVAELLPRWTALSGNGKAVWLITGTAANRAGWLRVCQAVQPSMIIDCFDFGLWISDPGIREPQYLRQRYAGHPPE